MLIHSTSDFHFIFFHFNKNIKSTLIILFKIFIEYNIKFILMSYTDMYITTKVGNHTLNLMI